MGCMDRRPFDSREKALDFAVNRCPMRGTPENFEGGSRTYPCGMKRDFDADCDFHGEDYRNCKYFPKKS
jgi:hypothetical protein